MQLRADGQFASLSRNNAVLAVVPLYEQSGSWQRRGKRLIINSVARGTREWTRNELQIVTVSPRRLRVRTADGHADTYRRLPEPPCAPVSAHELGSTSSAALVGRWRGHYRTHEIEVSLRQRGRGAVWIWDIGSKPVHGNYTWQLANRKLVMTPQDNDGKIEWSVHTVERNCLSFDDGSGMRYTLERLR
jgi:hypothetical protein